MTPERHAVATVNPEPMSQAEPESWAKLRARSSKAMTPDQAEFVRRARVDEGETCRGVSERFSDQFDDALYEDDLSGNQIVGKYLCESAALLLAEADDAPPWN
jgi:hypothetical protein